MAIATSTPLTEAQVNQYRERGYLIVEGVLTQQECQELMSRAAVLHARGRIQGCFEAVPEAEAGGDILKVYPRMMHPHRIDDVFLHYLKHPRITAILEELIGSEVVGIQSMFYWKPPGAKGQAFHQDSFYVRCEPETGIAAWTALEETDEENGGLIVFEGTQHEPILEMIPTDTSKSFTSTAVVPPPHATQRLVRLKAGDTLFFGGRVIHGSEPNSSNTRFRRSLICHYVAAETTMMADFYKPVVPLR